MLTASTEMTNERQEGHLAQEDLVSQYWFSCLDSDTGQFVLDILKYILENVSH